MGALFERGLRRQGACDLRPRCRSSDLCRGQRGQGQQPALGLDPGDITAAQEMPIEAGATYVFDLGYYDYRWWAKLDAAGCRIVTRFKYNTPLRGARDCAVAAGSSVLSDRVGHLPARQVNPKARRNPFSKPVREVRVKLDSGKVLRILSNDLEAPAQQIADLYKRRWAIELFFRWVKQTLKIRHFLGTGENAVRIQVAVALIAFLLLRLAQATQSAVQAPLAFEKCSWCGESANLSVRLRCHPESLAARRRASAIACAREVLGERMAARDVLQRRL